MIGRAIISASRRTDVPAFYAEWMVRRLREGYCTVPNPFDRNQAAWISLRPEDVDAIVFWTRNPRPLMPYLDELDSRGYRYYFQFTILGYPREIDPKSPAAASVKETQGTRDGAECRRHDDNKLSSSASSASEGRLAWTGAFRPATGLPS
jgi:hypothetical protein